MVNSSYTGKVCENISCSSMKVIHTGDMTAIVYSDKMYIGLYMLMTHVSMTHLRCTCCPWWLIVIEVVTAKAYAYMLCSRAHLPFFLVRELKAVDVIAYAYMLCC